MNFEAARANMVESQIRTTDVTSHSLLKAFYAVSRENFLPENLKVFAYIDKDLQISPAGAGKPARYLMEPSPVAKLLQLAAINKQDRVLDVGCGTGYVSAILSHVAGQVVALECDEELAATAKSNLSSYENVSVVQGPLEKGYASGAPYSVIFMSGSVEEIPTSLFEQLAERGKLIAVQGQGHAGRATVFTRERGAVSETTYFNVGAKPLPGFAKAPSFVF